MNESSNETRCKGRIHRYRRLRSPRGKPQWKCMDCASYTYNSNDLLGRTAHCFYCGNVFTITPDTLRYVHLKCGTNLEQCRENIEELVEITAKIPRMNDGEDTLRQLVAGAFDPEKSLEAQMRATVRKAIRSESEQDVSESEGNLLKSIVEQSES